MKYKTYGLFFLYDDNGHPHILVGTGPKNLKKRTFWHLPGGSCSDGKQLEQLKKECIEELGDAGRCLWGVGTTRRLKKILRWESYGCRISVFVVDVRGQFWGALNGETPVTNGAGNAYDPAFTHCCLLPFGEAKSAFQAGADVTDWFLTALGMADRGRFFEGEFSYDALLE